MGSRGNLEETKQSLKVVDEEEEEEEEDEEEEEGSESKRIRAAVGASRKLGSSSGFGHPAGDWVPTARPTTCQADNCMADMTEAKRYHRRHKVCEPHAKAAVVLISGMRQRFCQQCSRFHDISEFDEAKRSCRRRLAGHNERRRKSSSDFPGEGGSN